MSKSVGKKVVSGIKNAGKMAIPVTGKTRRARLKRQNSWLAWESRLSAPSVKLDLHIECRRLPKKDSFSDCDAFCGIWEAPAGVLTAMKDKKVSRLPSKQEKEVGRTEVVRENEHPQFQHTFRMEYRFQEQQTYVIRVYDEDLRYATDLKEHDFVGGCVFTLGELMGAAGCTIAKPLQSGKAFVVLTGHEIVESREVLEFRFSGQNLGIKKALVKDTNVLENFDVYFQLEKLQEEDQSWTVVWKSEIEPNNQNPTWAAARLPLQQLCDDDPSNALKITIWIWNRFTPDELVGFVETTINDLVLKSRRGIPVFDVMLEKKNLFRGTTLKKAGIFKVLKASILNIPSMLQYLSGGCELDLMVAIDCTSSNGDWRLQKSLHYSSDTWLNDYQAALFKVGSIFDGYNIPKGYIMWGYGGKIDGVEQPYFVMGERIRGADNLVKAYDKVFNPQNEKLALGNDGALKHIIQAAMFRALDRNKGNGKQCYSTLVILTTGVISDVQESVDAICAAAEDAPLSIAIIGIGDGTAGGGDFNDANQLVGGEKGKLQHSNGVPIARDIVNFATMTEFGGNARECVGEAFREIPEQFVQHFTNSGIKPLPPKAVPDFTVDEVFGRKPKTATPSKGKSKDKSKSKKSKKSSHH